MIPKVFHSLKGTYLQKNKLAEYLSLSQVLDAFDRDLLHERYSHDMSNLELIDTRLVKGGEYHGRN